MNFEFANVHYVFEGVELCFTELLNTILAFIKKLVGAEFPEVNEFLD